MGVDAVEESPASSFGVGRWGAVVQVFDAEGAAVGAGFLVDTDILVTCAHVVVAAGGGPGERVRLGFPLLAGAPQVVGRVLAEAWRAPDAQDVAVVRLDNVPPDAPVLGLGSAAGCRGHRVSSFGFPAQAPNGGQYGYGVAGDLLPSAPGAGALLQLTGANDLTTGFSGGPVIDEVIGLVIGMVTAISPPDAHLRGAGIAYATPAQTLREVWPGLAEAEVCPYRGLEAFRAEHAGWFHGRAGAVDRVLAGLAGPRRALLLLGPSGAGKSSLVQAGVLPALAAGGLPGSDRWIPVLARPGQDLLAEMDGAGLPGAGRDPIPVVVERRLAGQPTGARVPLVIDQFEELLTPPATDDRAAVQHEVIDQLAAAIGSPAALSVVLVMRDDFYPRLAGLAPRLLQALTPGLVNVPATLDAQDLRDIITKPAATMGARCQDGLPERIIVDVLAADSRANLTRHASITVLPLLELTLQQLWERRRDGSLTHEAYHRIGGVTGSLATWCDTAINQLPTSRMPIAQRLLTALVRPADDARHIPAVRQQVPVAVLRDLADTADPTSPEKPTGQAADEVLARLTSHRIITTRNAGTATQANDTTGLPVAELVHDALIRDWGTLRDWVNQDHRFQDWLRRADERRTRWANHGDPGDLLDGTDLAEGIDWSKQRRLPHDTAAFVTASRQRQTAGIRRTRRLNSILAALLVVALIAVTLALWQRQSAITQQQIAVAAQRAALSRQLAVQSTALLGTDPDLASLLAVHAYRTTPTTEATASLYAAAALRLQRHLTANGGAADHLQFSPDGRTLAAAGSDGSARLWDTTTGNSRTTVIGHPSGEESAAFSPDARTLATSFGQVQLRDVATGRTKTTLIGYTGTADDMVFSLDGRTLATSSSDKPVQLWNAATGQPKTTFTRPASPVISLAFSPDGRTLATGEQDGRAQLWDVATGRTRATFTSHTRLVWSLAFSPDGHTLATGSEDQTVRLWDLASGQTRATLTGHTGGIKSVAFSPDGRTLATGSADRTARLWDVASGQPWATLTGHTGVIYSVAFSPDSRTLATGGREGTARLWDVASGRTRTTLTGPADHIAFSPDKRTLATFQNREARLWDAATGQPNGILTDFSSDLTSMAFSSDGHTLATGDRDGTARLWDVATGQLKVTLTGHTGPVVSMVLSPDGRTLATADPSRMVQVWDVATGHVDVTPISQSGEAWSEAFSPDGRTLATGEQDFTVKLWDVTTGHLTATLTGHTDHVQSAVFSPDGRTLATGDRDGNARLWSVATGLARATLTGHTGIIESIAFSPDGRTLATGSDDHTARLWDVTTGLARATLTEHNTSVSAVAFSPDGRVVATGDRDSPVRLWSIAMPDPVSAINKICQAVGRALSALG